MANVDWGQEVRPSVHDLIEAVNDLESYTDVEREVIGTFLSRNVIDGVSGEAEIAEIRGNTEVSNGELLNVNISGIKTVGRNLVNFDIAYVSNPLNIQFDASKAINVKNGTRYLWEFERITNTTTWRFALKAFDLNGNVIDSVDAIAGMLFGYNVSGRYYVTGSNVSSLSADFTPAFDGYIMPFFVLGNTSASSTMVKPYIHLYGNGDGDYVPYMSDTLEFPMKTLRGIGTAQDVMTSGGIERKIASVDLTNANWVAFSTSETGVWRFYTEAIKDVVKPATTSNVAGNILCVKYPTLAADRTYTKNTGIAVETTGRITVFDPSVTTTAEMQAAARGLILYYEVVTPTTEQFETPIDLTYSVEEGGTEAWIVPEGDAPTSAPPAATIRYKMQYEYELITEKSFDNFCDALGTALNLDISKEWNAETKEWDFTITQAASTLHSIRESEAAEIEEPIETSKDELKPIDNVEPVKEVVENE